MKSKTEFIHANGKGLVDSGDEPIQLKGWGLGNWLVPEGYMWLADQNPRFDRPRRIEGVVRELLGTEAAKAFWNKYRENYITINDLQYIRTCGYNSIRVPVNWRLFMSDEPQTHFIEAGFELVDHLLDMAKAAGLYVVIDMHAAPGGQTGANIDDGIDDIPRLFIDSDNYEKGLLLWQKIATRYAENETVAGYDLLNEPLRPTTVNQRDFDYLVPQLKKFYQDAIKRIRKVDQNHLVVIEGHHWATSTDVVDFKYDDNEMVEFHRYAVMPDVQAFKNFLTIADKLNVPLWLGETGENLPIWNTAITKICDDYNISYHFWPFKKMQETNGLLTYHAPKNWQKIIDYTHGEARPEQSEINRIFEELLHNVKFENCEINKNVDNQTLRKAPYQIRASDFNTMNTFEKPYEGHQDANVFGYRKFTGIEIGESRPKQPKQFTFDTDWTRFHVTLHKDEFVTYTVRNKMDAGHIVINLTEKMNESDQIAVYENSEVVKASVKVTQRLTYPLIAGEGVSVKIQCTGGNLSFDLIEIM